MQIIKKMKQIKKDEITTEKKHDLYPVEECCLHINNVINDSIIHLYDSIDNYIFQDIEYSHVIPLIPQWVADVGISVVREYKSRTTENDSFISL